MLRSYGDAVVGFLIGQAVVGQLQFTADFIIAGDYAFFFHPTDIFQSVFGLFDVACQHFPLLVVTEKRHVLLQQYQLDFGFVVGTG